MKFPDRNQPLEAEPNIRKIQEELVKVMDEVKVLRAWRDQVSSKQGAAAGDATDTNVQVRQNTRDIIELWDRQGVPPGGWRGSVLVRDVDKELKWTTPIGSIVPRYYITLTPEGSYYDLERFGSAISEEDRKKLLPEPLLEYDAVADITFLDWPVAWGDEWFTPGAALESNPMPIELEVYLQPQFDGQQFSVTLPSSYASGAPWYTVTLYNETSHSAYVELFAYDTLMYEGGVQAATERVMQPREWFTWHVRTGHFASSGMLLPFWSSFPVVGSPTTHVPAPTDGFFWKNVRALEQQESFSASGVLAEADGALAFTNARNSYVRIGKVTARLGTAPTGSGVEIQVYKNGTIPILSTPLVVPAGQLYAEAIPDAGGVLLSNSPLPADPAVLLAPDEFLTMSILDVGSTTPGADLTGQIYYG